ncbi:CHAT domain-containing protein [uncultured Psychroserpens sp.]|uniref:CHAT domain-containing protein n=1 Tax=uncultured Psychroserpens sp. TaxID=255436 RepID=UPI002609539B|nr:CHAT domain-containing protein [uncultured Psychroserpens sp.]
MGKRTITSYIQYILVILFSFFIHFSSAAQDASESYTSIKNLNLPSKDTEQKLDSLFQSYEDKQNYKALFNDAYHYARWLYSQKPKQIDKAISISHKAINSTTKDSSYNDSRLGSLMHNLAYFYKYQNNIPDAVATYQSITEKVKSLNQVSDAYLRLGELSRLSGDLYKSAEYYEASIAYAKKDTLVDPKISRSIDASIIYKLIATPKSYERGIELLEEAEKAIVNNTIDVSKLKAKTSFFLYNHLGNIYNESGKHNYEKVKTYYDKALAIAIASKNTRDIASINNDLGFLLIQNEDPNAITYLDNALSYQPNTETTAIIYRNRTRHFLLLNDEQRVFENLQKSFETLIPNIDSAQLNNETLSLCTYKSGLLTTLIMQGQAWLKFYDPSKPETHDYLSNALRDFKQADDWVDLIRFNSNEQKTKLFWRTIASDIYTNATKVCFLLNKPEEAFYFMEKNKSLLLLEDITLQQLKEKANIPLDIQQEELRLKRNIVAFTEDFPKEKSADRRDTLRLQMLQSKALYERFLDSINTDYKQFYIGQQPAKILTLNEAQKTLSDADTVYLNYILNDQHGYGLLITKDSSTFFEIDKVSELLKDATQYRKLLETPFVNQGNIDLYNEVSKAMYIKLFPKSIHGSIEGKKLIIIPDYYLQNIPFEALKTLDNNNYLIQSNDITYAYSISFLTENSKRQRINDTQFFGLAPINFTQNLVSLPKSKEEIENISKLFSSNIYINDSASSKNFFDNINNHSIIHLASHANANDSLNPWIAYSDKKISLNELYLSENSADLVVLSACQTSLGTLNKGEGVMSLARGFFNTGSNSVLSSLWNVNDKSSSEIMIGFYKNLKQGKTKSEALRLSKLDYINSHELSDASPYYWASFVLIGDSEAVPSLEGNSKHLLLIIGVILTLLLLVFLYFKLKK